MAGRGAASGLIRPLARPAGIRILDSRPCRAYDGFVPER